MRDGEFDMTQELANFMPYKKHFTPKEVANFFSVSDRTIKRMCEKAEIDAIRVSGMWRISRSSLSTFIAQMKDKV